jgi:hypothetical protein
MATDWDAIRAEYVAGSDSIKKLSLKYGVSENGLEKRAGRERWAEARRRMSEKVIASAETQTIAKKVTQITRFNDDDLKVAKGLRQAAAQMMSKVRGPNDLRALAGVFESAQRLGRIALGADSGDPDGGEEAELPVVVTIERKSARVDRGVT